MSKTNDFITEWLAFNCKTEKEKKLAIKAMKDITDFNTKLRFKTIPDDAVELLRKKSTLPKKWYSTISGDNIKLTARYSASKKNVRCRCCKEIIKEGEIVINFSFKSIVSVYIMNGSIHERQCGTGKNTSREDNLSTEIWVEP